MKFYIKNMVCDRCKMVVETEFKKLGLDPISVALGEVFITEDKLPEGIVGELGLNLDKFGFQLLTDKKEQLVAQIKSAIIELVHRTDEPLKVNLSHHLSEKLQQAYYSLSSLFSENTGATIEKYFIQQKIERVKELLLYNEKSLSEIAYQLNYSSVAHLSSQFKKECGQTPSDFKRFQQVGRRALDNI